MAYLTLSGKGMKAENVSLSHSLDETLSGDIGCLPGHTESSRCISLYKNIQCPCLLKHTSHCKGSIQMKIYRGKYLLRRADFFADI